MINLITSIIAFFTFSPPGTVDCYIHVEGQFKGVSISHDSKNRWITYWYVDQFGNKTTTTKLADSQEDCGLLRTMAQQNTSYTYVEK